MPKVSIRVNDREIRPALTVKPGNRETFMKGIDYSYYFEKPDSPERGEP